MAELLLEKFKINNKCELNSEDIKSLTLLYLPLIGLDSYALYQTLCTLDNDEHNFRHLINITNIQTLKSLNNAFDKLEAIGLLKTYHNKDKDKGYLFELVRPLTEREFAQEEFLINLLETQIGPTETEKIKNKYKPISKSFKEVTKKFTDVFSVETKSDATIIDELIKNSKPTFTVDNPDFNYTLFKMYFDTSFMSEDVLEEQEFKSMIYKLSSLYKLNEEEMHDVVFSTITLDKRCDYAALSKTARMKFKDKYKEQNPKLVTIKDDEYVQSIQDDTVLRLCNALESSTPADVLADLSGIEPSAAELKIAEDLQKNTNLTIGAINFMLEYVIKEKDGECPSYNYFEKIANTWARAKVKTAIDAIRYTEKKNKEKKEPKEPKGGYNRKHNAPVPDWYKEYEKNLDNKETGKEKDKKAEPVDKDLVDLAKSIFED